MVRRGELLESVGVRHQPAVGRRAANWEAVVKAKPTAHSYCLVPGGACLRRRDAQVVLKNKNPVTIQVSISVQSSLQDTRLRTIRPRVVFLYPGAGEEQTLLLPVAGMSGIVPGCVTCTAYIVDERVTLRDSRR
jgi:hypothetical protein